jgi:hypothetical protein
VFDITATAEELQVAGATLRLLLDGGVAQLTEDGALLPDLVKRRVENAAAVELRYAGHRCRGINSAVGREAETGPSRAGQIVLDTGLGVEPEFQFLDVVDGDPFRAGHVTCTAHALQDLGCSRQIRKRTHENPATTVRPQEMDVCDPEFRGKRQERRRICQVMPQQHHRDRRPQSCVDGDSDAVADALESALAANRIVYRRRGTVQADLHAQAICGKSCERSQPLSLQHGAVRQNDELSLMRSDDVFDQFNGIRACEGLAASQIEPLHTKSDRLVNRSTDRWPWQPLIALGSRRHETVRAREIAEVVHLDPELLQPIGTQVGGPTQVRQRDRTVCGYELLTQGVPNERVNVQPGPADVEIGIGRVGTDDISQGRSSVQVPQNSNAALVCRDPVRCCRIDRDEGAGGRLNHHSWRAQDR